MEKGTEGARAVAWVVVGRAAERAAVARVAAKAAAVRGEVGRAAARAVEAFGCQPVLSTRRTAAKRAAACAACC